MKKLLLVLSIPTCLWITGCADKEESKKITLFTNPNFVPTYPSTYKYSGISNVSAITTYDTTGQIDALNHLSVTDTKRVNFMHSFEQSKKDSLTLTIINSNQLRWVNKQTDTTYYYSIAKNKLYIIGAPYIFTIDEKQLAITYFLFSISKKSGPGIAEFSASVDKLNGTLLETAKSFINHKPDTLAAQTFDLSYSRLK